MIKIIPLLLLFAISISLHADNTAKITINTKNVNSNKISKLINGGFIELANDFVNGYCGLWAQEIMDRGFEEVYNERETYQHWSRYFNDRDTVANKDNVTIVEGGYNRTDNNQLRIENAEYVESGIYQLIRINDEISHNCYIYARSENANGVAKIVLFDTLNQQRFFEKELPINSDAWTKIEFEIPAIQNQYTLNFAITYKGSGTVYFDEVSLMPTDNENGIRKEWIELLRIWKPTIMRYPGGFFAEILENDWYGSIYDIDQRKTLLFLPLEHTVYTQRYDFGTDEYMKLCEMLDMEPLLVINPCRTEDESANYIEYCNGDTNTTWGKIRKANGHPMPYNVKYWELENERYFYWSMDRIIKNCKRYDAAMRAVDNSFFSIVNGNAGDLVTMDSLLTGLNGITNGYGYHVYGGWNGYVNDTYDDEKVFLYEMYATYGNTVKEHSQKIADKYPNVKLAVTEWGATYGINDDWDLDNTVKRNISLEAGLWNSLFYNNLLKYPQAVLFAARCFKLGMINYELDAKGKKVIYPTPSFHSLVMLDRHRGDYVVDNAVECGTYTCVEPPIYWAYETPWIDATTTITDDTLFIAVVNRNPNYAMTTEVKIDTKFIRPIGKIYELTSNNYLDYNTADEPDKVRPIEKNLDLEVLPNNNWNDFTYQFPKHSLTILAIPFDKEHSDFSVYPNPFTNSLYISFNTVKTINKVLIYNAIGEVVFSKTYNMVSDLFSITNIFLPIGAYSICIETAEGNLTKNIIRE
ncbi:MAG: T9SS type A sorting domain-containing protein [Ignavibacteria bacterium]|jgi:alpha-N-arabinofuranosidase|nr:T9SS type A sorting domain-containing protein [Ignavibacteria bacterium]